MTDIPARGRATTTLPEMRRGSIAACQATVLARARPEARPHDGPSRLNLDFANQEIASATARGQLAYYELLERRGWLRMIRTAADLDAHWRGWSDDPAGSPIGYILAMASHPSFDPNIFTGGINSVQWRTLTTDPMHPLQDRATQGDQVEIEHAAPEQRVPVSEVVVDAQT